MQSGSVRGREELGSVGEQPSRRARLAGRAAASAATALRRASAYRRWKSVADRLLALVALIVLSPLLAVIALLIRLDSKGNPIFSQERVGKDARRFVLHKFRSMHTDHDDRLYQAFIRRYVQDNVSSRVDDNGRDVYQLIHDPRVTRVGAFLRKTNLDELPQLVNMLRGEMSLVGPRPDIPFAVDMYREEHLRRFEVTPGITGLWQVSGRKNISFEDMVRLDMDYIRHQSLLLDVRIVLKTVRTLLRREGS